VRIRPDGTVVEGSQVTVGNWEHSGAVIAVAFDGTEVLAAVFHDNAYYLITLDRHGHFLSETLIDYEPGAVAARLGGGFFVLRRDLGVRVAAGGDRFGFLEVTSFGELLAGVLDASGTEIDRFPIAARSDNPSIVWNGREWLTVYQDDSQLCTAAFTGSHDLRRECVESPGAGQPAIAVGSHGTFRVWQAAGGMLSDAGPVSTGSILAAQVSAVTDDAGLLVAWTEQGLFPRIVLGGLANDGSARPEHHIDAFWGNLQLSRTVDQTLLVYASPEGVKAVRIDDSGSAIPPVAEIGLDASFAVVARGDEWVVAGHSAVSGELVSARLTHNLDVSPFEHFGGTAFQRIGDVAATARGYLVVWTESEHDRVRVVAEPLDPSGRRISGGIRIVDGVEPIYAANTGCGPSACLVTWQFGRELRGLLVGHDGRPLTEIRTLQTDGNSDLRRTVIVASDDGAFEIFSGGRKTSVSGAGEILNTSRWHEDELFFDLGDVVTWRGARTAAYVRGGGVFAGVFRPRHRAVHH
jgi:hypothetical protein